MCGWVCLWIERLQWNAHQKGVQGWTTTRHQTQTRVINQLTKLTDDSITMFKLCKEVQELHAAQGRPMERDRELKTSSRSQNPQISIHLNIPGIRRNRSDPWSLPHHKLGHRTPTQSLCPCLSGPQILHQIGILSSLLRSSGSSWAVFVVQKGALSFWGLGWTYCLTASWSWSKVAACQ